MHNDKVTYMLCVHAFNWCNWNYISCQLKMSNKFKVIICVILHFGFVDQFVFLGHVLAWQTKCTILFICHMETWVKFSSEYWAVFVLLYGKVVVSFAFLDFEESIHFINWEILIKILPLPIILQSWESTFGKDIMWYRTWLHSPLAILVFGFLFPPWSLECMSFLFESCNTRSFHLCVMWIEKNALHTCSIFASDRRNYSYVLIRIDADSSYIWLPLLDV